MKMSDKENKRRKLNPEEKVDNWKNEVKALLKCLSEWLSSVERSWSIKRQGLGSCDILDQDVGKYHSIVLKITFLKTNEVVKVSPREIGKIEIEGPFEPNRNITLGPDGKWYTNDTPLDKDTFFDLIKSVTSSE